MRTPILWSGLAATLLAMLPAFAGTIVRVQTPLGDFDIELFDDAAPRTVANFLNYVDDGDYATSFVHRSVPAFVIQGGGFTFAAEQIGQVPVDAPVANEFGRSNLRGTVAMAKLGGDPDSATSQWFINLADNADPLDVDNGGYTVFGQVIGDGMQIVDEIALLPRWNFGNAPFNEVPLIEWGGGDVLESNVVFARIKRIPEPRALVLPDITGDGVADIGLLGTGRPTVELRDGALSTALPTRRFLTSAYEPRLAVGVPDLDDSGTAEIAVLGLRDSELVRVDVRDAQSGARVRQFNFYKRGYQPIDLKVLADLSGNQRAELALLAERRSDSQVRVSIRDALDGTSVGSVRFLGAGFQARALLVLPDLAGDGVPDLGVFATRNSDGRPVVEIRNADGSGRASRTWFLANGFVAVGARLGPDYDNNGVPELAVLGRRLSDGRFLVERKNASGAENRTRMWFYGRGYDPLDFEALPDLDMDGVPEYAVLARRQSDARLSIEIRNAVAPENRLRRVYLSASYEALSLGNFADLDADGGPDLGVLGLRLSDRRPRLELQNARDDGNTRRIWFVVP